MLVGFSMPNEINCSIRSPLHLPVQADGVANAVANGAANGVDDQPDESTLPKAKRARTQKAFASGDSVVAETPPPKTPTTTRRSRVGHEADKTTSTPLASAKAKTRSKRSSAPTPVREAETIGEAFATC